MKHQTYISITLESHAIRFLEQKIRTRQSDKLQPTQTISNLLAWHGNFEDVIQYTI